MDTRNAYAYLATLVFEVETFGVWPPQIKKGQYAPTGGTLSTVLSETMYLE